jgi:hypothetical protein
VTVGEPTLARPQVRLHGDHFSPFRAQLVAHGLDLGFVRGDDRIVVFLGGVFGELKTDARRSAGHDSDQRCFGLDPTRSRRRAEAKPKPFDAGSGLIHELPVGQITLRQSGKRAFELTGERFVKRPDRLSVRLVVALAAGVIVFSDWTDAQAFDFFGLWGSDETPPPVSPATIAYILTVEVTGDDSALKSAVRDASSLYRLRKDAPADGEALARRAESDFAPIIDALWGAGYYNANVTISIDGATLPIASSDIAVFARAAEAY